MPRCTRSGCNKEFQPNALEACCYHSGSPVFHEGLKSWSCCNEVNKPVLEFDSFVAIPGCTRADSHTIDKPVDAAIPSTKSLEGDEFTTPLKMTTASNGAEIYSSDITQGSTERQILSHSAVSTQSLPPRTMTLEQDDLSVTVAPGTKCSRKGCGKAFVSDEESRFGDGDVATCYFHPLPPLFREGSKGYLCCKKRVLEFDEFLKIQGCQKGRHVFAPKKSQDGESQSEAVTCRVDHYQTPKEVYVSVFAKQADKEKSVVTFEETKLILDIALPSAKRFSRSIDLYGHINVAASSYHIGNAKVEIKLVKLDGKSWNMLEKSTGSTTSLNLTFGVGGRTGTVGGKELILDAENRY